MPKFTPFDNLSHLKTFPDHALRDIARNEAAQHDYRKHAVEVLLSRKSPLLQHPDLHEFVDELNVELDGLQFEYPPQGTGPLVASVTTETLNQPESVVAINTEAASPVVVSEMPLDPQLPQSNKRKRATKPKEKPPDENGT